MYHYAGNNPVKYVDPDGRCFDTIWDAFNASLDVASFKSNIISGNYVGAAWDFASLLYDGFATATPVLPGGTGSAKLISKLSAEYGDDAAKLVLKYADLDSSPRDTKLKDTWVYKLLGIMCILSTIISFCSFFFHK